MPRRRKDTREVDSLRSLTYYIENEGNNIFFYKINFRSILFKDSLPPRKPRIFFRTLENNIVKKMV